MSDQFRTIFVIDDDELFSEEVKFALDEAGYCVYTYGNLRSALDELQTSTPPALLFVDRMIEGEPVGSRLLGMIHESAPGILVVIYTRTAELSDREICDLQTAGASRVLDRRGLQDSADALVSELVELRDLRNALDALTTGRGDLMTALVGTDVGVSVYDTNQVCWFANKRQQAISQNACVGRFYWDALFGHPLEFGPAWGSGISDVLSNSKDGVANMVQRTILARMRDGSVKWLSLQSRPMLGASKQVIGCTVALSVLDDDYVQTMGPTARLIGVAKGLIHAGFGRVRIYRPQIGGDSMTLEVAVSRGDDFNSTHYYDGLEGLALEYKNCPYFVEALDRTSGRLVDSWNLGGKSPFVDSVRLSLPYLLVPIRNEEGDELLGMLAVDFVDWGESRKESAIQKLATPQSLSWIQNDFGGEIRSAFVGMRGDKSAVSTAVFGRQQAALRARQRIGSASSLDDAIKALRRGFEEVAPDCECSVRRKVGSELVAEDRIDYPGNQILVPIVRVGHPDSLAAFALRDHRRPLWIDDYPLSTCESKKARAVQKDCLG